MIDVTVAVLVAERLPLPQWRRQAWGTGARAPLEYDARKILQPFFVSTYRPITHIKALITVTVAGCCKKTLVIFVFAVLTPDGFHFWMTLSPRTSEPVRHASVPPPPGAKFWRRHCIAACI